MNRLAPDGLRTSPRPTLIPVEISLFLFGHRIINSPTTVPFLQSAASPQFKSPQASCRSRPRPDPTLGILHHVRRSARRTAQGQAGHRWNLPKFLPMGGKSAVEIGPSCRTPKHQLTRRRHFLPPTPIAPRLAGTIRFKNACRGDQRWVTVGDCLTR